MCKADFSRLHRMAAREHSKYFRVFFRHRNLIWGPIRHVTDSEPGSFIQRIFQATRLALRFAPRQIARKKRFGNQFRLVMDVKLENNITRWIRSVRTKRPFWSDCLLLSSFNKDILCLMKGFKDSDSNLNETVVDCDRQPKLINSSAQK